MLPYKWSDDLKFDGTFKNMFHMIFDSKIFADFRINLEIPR